jgi:hypothetical protein
MCDRRLRDLKRSLALLAKPFGATVKIENTSGGHFRAIFASGCWTLAITMPRSLSDRRSLRNTQAFVRRKLRRRAAA